MQCAGGVARCPGRARFCDPNAESGWQQGPNRGPRPLNHPHHLVCIKASQGRLERATPPPPDRPPLSHTRHHVVVPQQPAHQHDVALQQSAAADSLRRGRRRHRRRLAPIPSASRLLHGKRPTFSTMAPARPQGPAAAHAHAVCIVVVAPPAGTGGAHGQRRRRRAERPVGYAGATAAGTGAAVAAQRSRRTGRRRARRPRAADGQLAYTRAANTRTATAQPTGGQLPELAGRAAAGRRLTAAQRRRRHIGPGAPQGQAVGEVAEPSPARHGLAHNTTQPARPPALCRRAQQQLLQQPWWRWLWWWRW